MSSYDEYEPSQTWDDDGHVEIPSKRRLTLPRISQADASHKLTRLYEDGGVLDSQTTASQYVNSLLLGSESKSLCANESDVNGRYAVSLQVPTSERLSEPNNLATRNRDSPKRLAGMEHVGSWAGGLKNEDEMEARAERGAVDVKAEDFPLKQTLLRDDKTSPFLDPEKAKADIFELSSEQNSGAQLLLCSRCQSELGRVPNTEGILSNAISKSGSRSKCPGSQPKSKNSEPNLKTGAADSKGTTRVDLDPTGPLSSTENAPHVERDHEVVPESCLRPSEDYPGTRLVYEKIKRDFNAGGLLGHRDLIAVSLKVYNREQDAGRWPPTPRTIRRFWR